MDKHIVLVGMPGSGKSTLAARWSAELGVPCYSIDRLLEAKWGKSIIEFVQQHGWEKFREEEFAQVKEVLELPVGIIDAGAGFFTTEEKVKFTLAKTEVIYLEVEIEELVKRLSSEEERAKRPLLSEGDLRYKLDQLYVERSSFYELAEKVRVG